MTDINRHLDLFQPDSDWENNACLNFAVDHWTGYIMGYQRAAQLLCEHVLSTNRDQDVLIYPIVFLSRHYLELLLKRTIVDAKRLLNKEPTLPTHHRIDKIWEQLRPLILEVFTDEDPAELSELDDVISDLTELDAGSFSFRYPVDKAQNSTLPSELKLMNIRRFHEHFESAAAMLEAIRSAVAEYADFQREQEAQYS